MLPRSWLGQRMQFDQLKRREFITLLGGAAAVWPSAAGAQQPVLPVIGYIGTGSVGTTADRLRGFHAGLREAGFVEGDNLAVLYRWAEDRLDRFPELAADLVRRRVAVIATFGNGGALMTKAATATIPIVFAVGEDPVRLGLVASLARPGGNLTGINYLSQEVVPKRLDLLRTLVPAAVNVAVLVDPAVPPTETVLRELEGAAGAMGSRLQVFKASTKGEINAAFAALAQARPDALFVSSGFLFNSRRVQLVHLATLHKIPTAYTERQFVEVGGLLSYGASFVDAHRQMGVYVGRILKGAKPTDLPVMQSTKLEL